MGPDPNVETSNSSHKADFALLLRLLLLLLLLLQLLRLAAKRPLGWLAAGRQAASGRVDGRPGAHAGRCVSGEPLAAIAVLHG